MAAKELKKKNKFQERLAVLENKMQMALVEKTSSSADVYFSTFYFSSTHH